MFGYLTPEGPITASAALQNYVERIGQSLVPEYIKNKIKFAFIVVDNEGWNGGAYPSGLVLVYLGLIYSCAN